MPCVRITSNLSAIHLQPLSHHLQPHPPPTFHLIVHLSPQTTSFTTFFLCLRHLHTQVFFFSTISLSYPSHLVSGRHSAMWTVIHALKQTTLSFCQNKETRAVTPKPKKKNYPLHTHTHTHTQQYASHSTAKPQTQTNNEGGAFLIQARAHATDKKCASARVMMAI